MSEDIIHRGPDDHGYWFNDWCGVGARRLSIIDLSDHAHQPMFDATGTYLIVYNGEVYNFSQLRKQLEDEGVVFASTSDTEVVLQSYIRWGEACVSRFIGMFAFVIVNVPAREIFVARDQLGIKPIYYCEDRDFVYFSSEIKAFRHVIRFELNRDVLYEQFVFRYVAGESTPFKNIRKLLAGTSWQWIQGEAPRRRRYYDVTESLKREERVDEETYLSELRTAVSESIELHTASDVGYTVQLSGGLDSSFITAVLSKELGQRLDTFSIAIRGERYDESGFQRQVSEAFQTCHHELELDSESFADGLEKATWHMDVPILHMGGVLMMLLCQQSGAKSKVVLTGEGGDELFGGYRRYTQVLGDELGIQGMVAGHLRRFPAIVGMLPNLPLFRRWKFQVAYKVIDTQRMMKRPIMESFLQGVPECTRFRDAVVESQGSPIAQVMAHDQVTYLAMLLDHTDKMSMAASVEARVPFCNPQLFDMVNPIPAELKLKGNTTKYLLKKMGERYLERSLIYRRKNGLNLPVEDWMRNGPLSERVSLLTDQTARERGFYDNAAIAEAVDKHRSGQRDFGRYLVSILMFETWMRMFIDDQGRRPR